MQESGSWLYKLDHFIFEKIDTFKKSPSFSPIQDFYSSLEDEQQKIAKMGLVLLVIVFPLFLVLIMFLSNQSAYTALEESKSVITKSKEIINLQAQSGQFATTLLSDSPVDSQDAVNSLMLNSLGGTGIDLSKVKVTSYTSNEMAGDIIKSESDVSFESLTTSQLVDLFINLYQRAKVKVSDLNVEKNKTSQLLQGSFHLIHFSQKISAEE